MCVRERENERETEREVVRERERKRKILFKNKVYMSSSGVSVCICYRCTNICGLCTESLCISYQSGVLISCLMVTTV